MALEFFFFTSKLTLTNLHSLRPRPSSAFGGLRTRVKNVLHFSRSLGYSIVKRAAPSHLKVITLCSGLFAALK